MTFDDHLGLADRDFGRQRMVVFVGRSGSGKSTAIGFLRARYPAFVVVDELRTPRDLARLARPLRAGARLLVASHLAAAWFAPLALLMPVTVYVLDRDEGKIARYLRARNTAASPAAIQAYVRRFGATYTDVDIILGHFPSACFDRSLAYFMRHCTLTCSGASTTSLAVVRRSGT